MTALFGPQNANAALVLPSGADRQRYGTAQTWVQDCSAPGRNDGSILDAAFYNRIIGNLDYLVSVSGITANPGDMTALFRAIMAAISQGAPGLLDTIAELSAALGNDASFSTTIAAQLATRLRFDQLQTLTTGQKAQVAYNLGLAAPLVYTGSYTDLANLPTLGTASALNVGTAASSVVQLSANAKLPAVDGSALSNVNVTWGNVTGKPTLGTASALNVGTAANSVVQLDGSGKLPAVDGSALANVTVTWGNVTGKPTLGTASALNVGTTANNVVQLDANAKLPAVDGSQLTGVVSSGVGSVIYNAAQALTQAQRDQANANLGLFASGTVMLFAQASPPTGWTQVTTYNDRALRVVSGTPSSGGVQPFSTVFGRTQVDGTTLSSSQMPVHAHGVNDPTHAHTSYSPAVSNYGNSVASGPDPNANYVYDNNQAVAQGTSANGTGISLQNAGGNASHTHTIDLRVQYVDVLLASKN